MACQVLDFSVSLQENQLWDDRDCLQVDGELPKGLRQESNKSTLISLFQTTQIVPTYLHDIKASECQGCHQRQHGTWSNSKLPVQKRIVRSVVGAFEWFCSSHHVYNVGGNGDVQNFHDRVIIGVESGEKIEIARDEDQEVQLLCLDGDADSILRHSQAQQKHQDTQHVTHVTSKAKDIHRHGSNSLRCRFQNCRTIADQLNRIGFERFPEKSLGNNYACNGNDPTTIRFVGDP